jgi:PleD family two-component response regulator
MKIFIVDDDVFYLNIFKQHLSIIGFNDVTEFIDGKDCLLRLNEKPDVIFVDYNMDSISGSELITQIKLINPTVYIVMISAQSNTTPSFEALKLGAFDFVLKDNFVEKKLTEILNNIISIKNLNEMKNNLK